MPKKISIWCIVIGAMSIVVALLNALTVFFTPQQFSFFVKSIAPLPGLAEAMKMFTPYWVIQLIAQSASKVHIPYHNVILSPLGYILSVVLAVSGLGTIFQESWGRKLGLIYAKCVLVIAAISIPVFIMYLIHFPVGGVLAASRADLQLIATKVYFMLLFFYVLCPLILLVFFSRNKIKE
jgi:hypothetical protein